MLIRRLLIMAGLLWIAITACTPTQGSATAMLPNVPNTTVVNGQSITEFISKLANGASLTAGNPELIALIEQLQGSLKCMQDLGAVAVRTYTDNTFPLSAGLVAIVDRNAITNLANWQQCLIGGDAAAAAAPQLKPCAQTWTLTKNDNQFYIAYAATTAEMCAAFCAQLEGCPAR